MQFVVVAVDGPDFGSLDELHESHWGYMDAWSDTLVARGPTESLDGERHTGSVHVVAVRDLAIAQRFARDEPYARAGWYSTIRVSPIAPCVDGTMWDIPARATPTSTSALVTASCECNGATSQDLAVRLRQRLGGSRAHWIYVGVIGDEAGAVTGVLALMDDRPGDAAQYVVTLLDAAGISNPLVESSRWRRGGRPAD